MLADSLSGIRVLDLSRLYPGPLCTLMLSDLGAEVIKIESPEGEMGRYIPPYHFGSSANFLQLNRNKRSLTLNLKKPQGVEILKKLLSGADLIVESFRPRVMKRFRMDYESIADEFPGLIYCSISGYGQSGPAAQHPGHDLNYISVAGLLSLHGEGSRGYLIPPIQIADILGGFQGTAAICAALFKRFRTGIGQHLDISLVDGAFFTFIGLAGLYFSGLSLERDGLSLSGRLACYNIYRTADHQYLALGLLEPKFWQSFCLKMNLNSYVNRQLQEDQIELIDILSRRFSEKNMDFWLEFFQNDDLCITPVTDFAEATKNHQLRGRNLLVDVEYPSGVLQQFATPFVKQTAATGRAPLLGEHNYEILSELGYTGEEISNLKTEGVL
jgi:crotonobetainyl-CoA:carnitine CoA-transferase CaiB-like acyl-CoA transferase